YPGSPWFAAETMAGSEKLRLFELHPSDHQLLQDCFADAGRRVRVERANGFEAIKSLLPPPPRRALTLIDPPYEDKADYQHVVKAMKEALKRFATGTYAIWYPLLQRAEIKEMVKDLKGLPCHSWLDATLTVRTPSKDGFGMHGSGMFIVNPPWTLHATLQETLPWLSQALAVDDGAWHSLEYREN
ncbi:MAG: 23S rRNA (adenine(2030)-N(6))-methyltransferase RlmJ, partial [Vogesella sp.]|uniref:23S rRNA (adenine(2030)-N(6))-methyltransferase RlmJ n=1 Tax=Vogesella sp. TaxID=1904252 RepID=UPI003F3C86C9